jgi:hypothetical protein
MHAYNALRRQGCVHKWVLMEQLNSAFIALLIIANVFQFGYLWGNRKQMKNLAQVLSNLHTHIGVSEDETKHDSEGVKV